MLAMSLFVSMGVRNVPLTDQNQNAIKLYFASLS
jgi:hypothetical protein